MEVQKKWAKNLCRNIRFHRSSRNIRQADLAADSGINLRYYQSIESGRANITLEMIGRIAKSLGLCSSQLVKFQTLYIDYSEQEFIQKASKKFFNYDVPIIFVGPKNKISFVNQSFCDLLESSKSELIGKSIRDFIKPSDGIYFQYHKDFEESLGDCASFNLSIVNKSNDEFPIKANPLKVRVSRKNNEVGTLILFDKVKESQMPLSRQFFEDSLTLI